MSEKVKKIMQEARTKKQENDYPAAIELINSALEITPEDYQKWSVKGLWLSESGDIDGALEAFRRSTELHPSYPDFYNAGNMLLAKGQFGEALEQFNRSIELCDDYPEAWVNRGIVLTNLGRIEEGMNSFVRALAVDSDFHPAWRCRAIQFMRDGNWESAEFAYQRVTDILPDNPDAWYELGKARGTLPADGRVEIEPGGRDWRAVDALDRAVSLNPEHRESWRLKADILLRLSHAAQAVERAATAAGVPSVAAFKEVLQKLLQHLSEAKAKFPNDPYYFGITADAYADLLGDYSTAKKALLKVCRLAPENGFGHYRLAMVLESLGEMDTARSELDTAVELDPALAADIREDFEHLAADDNSASDS